MFLQRRFLESLVRRFALRPRRQQAGSHLLLWAHSLSAACWAIDKAIVSKRVPEKKKKQKKHAARLIVPGGAAVRRDRP